MRITRALCLLLLLITACAFLCACVTTTPPGPPVEGEPPQDEEEQLAYFYNGSARQSISLKGQSAITLPEAPLMAGEQFVGWCLEGDTPRLYRAGVSFDAIPTTGDLTFRAVGIRLSTKVGATLDESGERLCFEGKLDGEGYRRLTSLLGAESLTAGVLIAPYIEVTGGDRRFTVDCGAQGLLDRVSTPSATGDAASYALYGASEAVSDEALLEKLAARAYLAVTLDGKTDYFYAEYLPLEHTCSRYGAAAFMFEDLTEKADETHTVLAHTALGERYSPYSAERRERLKRLLDRVVNVDTDRGVTVSRYSRNNVDFYEFRYYTTPYHVAEVLNNTPEGFDSFVVRGEGGGHANIVAYFVGGSYRPARGDEMRADGYFIAVGNKTS